MSARKTRRITRLRQENEMLRKEIRQLVYQPHSDEAFLIKEKIKAFDSLSHEMARMFWFGNMNFGVKTWP